MVWGRRCHPEEKLLQNVQKEFGEHVSNSLISGMLDNLLTQGALGLCKVEKDQCRMHMDKASLIKHCALGRAPRPAGSSLRASGWWSSWV